MRRMQWILMSVAGLMALMWTPQVEAREVLMYARSNNDWKSYTQPGKYSALNLVDKVDKTVWCSEGAGGNVRIEVQFSGPVGVDRIGIVQGHTRAWGKYNRVRKMEVSDGDMMTQMVELEDRKGLQFADLEPAVESDRVIIKFKAAFSGSETDDRHTCLADLVFFDGDKALNGTKLKRYLKKAKPNIAVLDTWLSGPEGMKNRQLILGMDGTYRFKFIPSDPMDSPIEKAAAYRVKGKKLKLKISKRKWVTGRIRKDDAGRVLGIEFSSKPFIGSYIRRIDSSPLR